MWIVIGITVTLFVLGVGVILGLLFMQMNTRKGLLEGNVGLMRKEVAVKKEILAEVGELSLGLGTKESLEDLAKIAAELEEGLRSEQGRLTITQAELEAVESRLRELEEVERELEASALESAKEVEMLKGQHRDIENRNNALKEQLESSFVQIDMLLNQFTNSQETTDKLTELKTVMADSQEKIEYYTSKIGEINDRYVDLKNAYDALDIEYAQLYEKHNS